MFGSGLACMGQHGAEGKDISAQRSTGFFWHLPSGQELFPIVMLLRESVSAPYRCFLTIS